MIFGARRIVASDVALAHKGYLHHDRWPFAGAVLGALVVAALMIWWLPPLWSVWLLLLLTAQHALGQQMGVSFGAAACRAMAVVRDGVSRGWSAGSVVAMPAIGILGAWALSAFSKGSLLILMVTLPHAFFEARAWQRDSLHRQRVSFVA